MFFKLVLWTSPVIIVCLAAFLAHELSSGSTSKSLLVSDFSPSDFKMEQHFRAFVLGGTGAVGKELIKTLAETSQFQKVTLIGRRKIDLPTTENYAKFQQEIIDFDKLPDYAHVFKDHDVGFSSLGTTRGKSGADGFYKVDHDYVVETSKLAKAGGCKHLHLVSSGGANKNSSFLYPRTKGEVEAELSDMGFDRLSIYRPNLLLTPREESRPMESIFQAIVRPLDRARWFSIDVPILAKCIVQNSFRQTDKPVEILDNGQINKMGKGI